MTEDELKLELECYQMYINPGCDINNLTEGEIEDFFNYYKKSECYLKGLSDNMQELLIVKY